MVNLGSLHHLGIVLLLRLLLGPVLELHVDYVVVVAVLLAAIYGASFVVHFGVDAAVALYREFAPIVCPVLFHEPIGAILDRKQI